jgi:hypothetical protein
MAGACLCMKFVASVIRVNFESELLPNATLNTSKVDIAIDLSPQGYNLIL